MTTVAEFRERQSDLDKYGEARGRQAGTRDERARCRAILTAPESKVRFNFAKHLALETDLDVQTCIGMLRAAPPEVQPTAAAAGGSRADAEFYAAHAAAARAGASGRDAGDEPGLRSRFVRDAEKLRAEGKLPQPPVLR